MASKLTDNNKWYQQVWLPFAAGTYILICIFDFLIMPVYITAHNSKIENAVFAKLETKDAISFSEGLIKSNQAQRQWNPLTLLGAGMFHLAFGALLTGGAVTRGMAKRSEVEGYYRSGAVYDSDDSEYYGPSRNRYDQGRYGRYRDRNEDRQESTATNKPMPKTENLEDE